MFPSKKQRGGPKAARANVIGPNQYSVAGMTYTGPIVGGAQEGDVVPVVFGRPDSWRQPLAFGMPGQGTISFPLSFFAQEYPIGLPLAGGQWAQHGHDESRSRNTGHTDLRWYCETLGSFPIVSTYLCSAPVVYGNRVFVVVDGRDTDERITAKLEDSVLDPQERTPETPTQTSPYRLRIAHQNITQGSDNGQSGQPGNGNPADFERNLRIWDLVLSDATGITWEDGAPGLVPVDLSIQDYVEREFLEAHVEERCWVTITWAAPSTQPPGGRKCSRDRDDSEPHWMTSGDNRFFVSRHLVNFRRTYIETSNEQPVPIEDHPMLTQTVDEGTWRVVSASEITHVWAEVGVDLLAYVDSSTRVGQLTIQDKPCLTTWWVTELTHMPLGSPVFRGEDSIEVEDPSADLLHLVCGETSTELSSAANPPGIEKIYVASLNAETGEILGETEISLGAPAPDWPAMLDDRPAADVGPVPWFDPIRRLGDEFLAGYGLLLKSGYLADLLVHRTTTEGGARGTTYLIPRVSYGAQLVAIAITDGGSASLAWALQGWSDWPTTYRAWTVCGMVEGGILAHFEEFEQQAGSNIFAIHGDLAGMIAYEQGIGSLPPDVEDDDFFTVYEWPPDGFDRAFQTADGSGETSLGEIGDMFDWAVEYWTGREDADGWEKISTSQVPRARRQGFALIDPTTGVISDEDYILVSDGTITTSSGDLVVEYFISEFVEQTQDPADVDDVNGKVWMTAGGPNPLIEENFGCVTPLAAGENEIFAKSWSVRYPWDGASYDNPNFLYTRSNPSYQEGSPDGSGAWSDDTQGDYLSGTSGPRGDFSVIDWGRRFVVLRFRTTGTNTYDYSSSAEVPFSPTKTAFHNAIAVYLSKISNWLVDVPEGEVDL